MKIEIDQLEHVYPTGEKALNGVSFTLEGTDPVAIIGQNGAGKTTVVKHFNGILRPTGGHVRIDGVDIEKKETPEWSAHVGYVFQNPDDQLFLDSVREEFEFGPRQIGMDEKTIKERIKKVSKMVGLEDKLEVNPFDLMPTEKKFCTIGSIIMMNPDAVVFDEPTCGQDIRGNQRLLDIIAALQDEGKLCVTISHDMKFVTACFKRVIVMCKGRVLLDGPTRDVFAQVDTLKKSFVTPPPITRVASGAGISRTVFSIPEFRDAFIAEREKNHV